MKVDNHHHSVLGLLFLIVIAIGCIGFPAMSVKGQTQEFRWYHVGNDAVGKKFLIDMYSVNQIEPKDRFRFIWTKVLFKDESYTLNQNQWDCENNRFKILKSVIYSPQGNYLGEEKLDKKWASIPPESVAERFSRIICYPAELDDEGNPVFDKKADNINRKKSKQKSKIQIIAKFANVRESPSMNSKVITKVENGKVFDLGDATPSNGWFQIQIISSNAKEGNRSGWIHGNVIKFVDD